MTNFLTILMAKAMQPDSIREASATIVDVILIEC